jgi:predicted Zn-dependent peptidase
MSARLFTEVREKQGLVYWVGAWTENPWKSGMVLVGAAAMLEHCAQVYDTLLRELERVGQDVTAEEVERALTGIAVRADIRAAITRVQCNEQADDLFHYGRPVPWEEKLARLQAVTADDVRDYCGRHMANGGMSVVFLGPHPLAADGAEAATEGGGK